MGGRGPEERPACPRPGQKRQWCAWLLSQEARPGQRQTAPAPPGQPTCQIRVEKDIGSLAGVQSQALAVIKGLWS